MPARRERRELLPRLPALQVAEPEIDVLREAAAELGLDVSARQAQDLVGYMRLLEHWNSKFNLVSRRDVERLLSRHILDSLSISQWLRGERVLDVGSGPGLPGIPLAMVNADRQFLLVDRSARKTRFLEQVVITFNLTNVTVQCLDVAELSNGLRYTTIVTRAVGGLPAVWQMVGRLLDTGGRLIFMNRTGLQPGAATEATQTMPELPDGLCITRELVRIPGLAGAHEVLLVEAAR